MYAKVIKSIPGTRPANQFACAARCRVGHVHIKPLKLDLVSFREGGGFGSEYYLDLSGGRR